MNLHLLESPEKRMVALWGCIAALVIAAVLAYTILALYGILPLTWNIFWLLLGLLFVVNSIFGLIFWKHRQQFDIPEQIAMILWCGVSLWYWSLAPFYHAITINTDSLQLRWLAFSFAWEVPVFGFLFTFLGIRLFNGVWRHVKKDPEQNNHDPMGSYEKTIHYPAAVAYVLFGCAILGYVTGTIQLAYFAHLPHVEQAKSIFNGIVVSLFLGIFFYLILDAFLVRTRALLKEQHPLESSFKRRLSTKILVIVFGLSFGGIALMGLLIFQSWQNIIEKAVLIQIRDSVSLIAGRINESPGPSGQAEASEDFARDIAYGASGRVFFLEANSSLPASQFSEETRLAVRNSRSGIVRDLHDEAKIVTFLEDSSSDRKIASVVYLSDFYGILREPLQAFLLGGLLIVAVTGFMSIFVGVMLTGSLRRLARAVEVGGTAREFSIYSGDELEGIGNSFFKFAEEASMLRGQLEDRVREKTIEVVRKADELEKKNIALEESWAKDEALLESIGEGIIAADKGGRIIFLNRHAEEMLHLKTEEVSKKIFSEIGSVFPDGGSDVLPFERRPLTMALRQGVRVTGLYNYRLPDGAEFPVSITATPVVLKGEIIGAIEVFRDFSKEKQVEQAKSEFVSLASHQLRTPLSIINWYSEVLLANNVGEMSEQQTKFIAEMHRASKRMSALVNTILDVTKIELGTLSVNLTDADCCNMARRVVGDLGVDIASKKIKVTERYQSGIPSVKTDPRLLEIVFHNILSNAIRYTPTGGEITVDVSKDDKAEYLIFSVSDTGYGIPESQQQQIFTKMFRASNVKERDTQGTGLGLYIVKSIMAYLGGDVWFKSPVFPAAHGEEARGTIFFVSIPITRA